MYKSLASIAWRASWSVELDQIKGATRANRADQGERLSAGGRSLSDLRAGYLNPLQGQASGQSESIVVFLLLLTRDADAELESQRADQIFIEGARESIRWGI